MREKIPEYVLRSDGVTSSRDFRALKRAQAREVEKALDKLRIGCAYTPEGPKICDGIQFLLERYRWLLSVKEWGR